MTLRPGCCASRRGALVSIHRRCGRLLRAPSGRARRSRSAASARPGCQLGDLVELAAVRDRIAPAREGSHDHDRLFQRSYPPRATAVGTPRATISSHIPPAPSPRTTCPPEIVDNPCHGPGQNRSRTAEQICHDHRSPDVAGCAQDEPQRGVGVDTLGEVGMIADADQVEAGVVGPACRASRSLGRRRPPTRGRRGLYGGRSRTGAVSMRSS